jgi:hypothetical protein
LVKIRLASDVKLAAVCAELASSREVLSVLLGDVASSGVLGHA